MSNAEPRRRSKASAATERLSQSVSDIEFDPNSNSNNATTSRRRPHRSPSTGKRASSRESSRNVRRNHSSDHVVAAGTSRKTTAAAGSESKKRSTRKKSSSMHADSSNTMSKNHDHLNAPNAMNSSDTKDHKPSSTLKRKKKRPTEDALHASKDTLNSSRTSSLNASRDFSAAASKTSLHTSKDSQEQERRRQRSRSRSKSSAPRGQQRRSNSRPKTNATPRSSASRRDRSTSRDSHRKTSASAGERPKRGDTITANHATATQQSARCTTVKSTGISSTTTMAVPVKNSNNKLYDVDRPRQRSLKKQSAHDDVSVQSNQLLLTKEQRAWKGIDDILNDDEDHDSIATRDVLPPTVAKAMQQEKEQRAINNGALPPLMNSSFSSIQTEMTNLTLNTAVTSANNYVVQPPAANDPMQAFLGSIAENLLAETCDGEHQPAGSKMTAATSESTIDFETENDESKTNKKEMLSSMSTTTSSSGSIGIQEYYAKTSARQQHMHDNDEQGSSEDEDRRYDPTVQAYGRASMPPKKPNQSISVDGQSVVENMPTLMDSSFSSLLSEVTDIQSIISTAKNFVVKDETPDNDDPMSAFLGRITNGLRARQMLIEEEGVVEDDTVSNGEQEEDVLDEELDDAYADDDGDVEQDKDVYIADGHIPAEDELSGAGRSVPDEGDLSGADEDHVDEESGSNRGDEIDDENDDLHDESEEDDDDFDEPGIDAAIYPIPPNTPGGVTSLPSLSSVSTVNTHLHSQVDAHVDPLAKWAASLRLELAKKMADENKLPTAEEQELAEMEIALARAAEIAAQEKNETDITRVVLDEEVIQGVTEESERERAKAAEPIRKKKVTKKGSAAPGATDNAGVKATRGAARPPPGRRKVLKKKKLPVQPLPAPAEEPEKFSAMFKEEQRPEQVPRPKQSMPVAAVKAVAKAAMPIPKSSKKEKYEQKSTLKSLKEKLKKMSFLRGKSSRRNSPMSVNVGGDEQKYFPKDNREEDEDEDASFL